MIMPILVVISENCLSLRTLNKYSQKLLIKNSISPLPLYKSLVLLDCIKRESAMSCCKHAFELALANALVFSISNLLNNI